MLNINSLGNKLLFATSREGAVIPTKREEDAGYDIYPCFEEDYIIIKPHETKMIPTGLHCAFSSDYYMQLEERGSTGTKGIGQRCGVIDSGYRGEIHIPITNTNSVDLVITKKETVVLSNHEISSKPVFYPYSKALCQGVILPVPKMKVEQVSLEELMSIESERGENLLGSSGK